MAGNCIIDNDACVEASKQEIIRRYYKAWCDYKNGLSDKDVAHRVEALMKELDIKKEDRKVVQPAIAKAEEAGTPAIAIEMADGKIITGKATKQLGAAAAAVINAIKHLADINDSIHLISPAVLEPMQDLKKNVFGSTNPKLNLEEALLALSVCAATNAMVELALTKLDELSGLEAHYTKMLSPSDEKSLRKLKINVTCEPEFQSDNLFIQ